jgi:hypothetical protein
MYFGLVRSKKGRYEREEATKHRKYSVAECSIEERWFPVNVNYLSNVFACRGSSADYNCLNHQSFLGCPTGERFDSGWVLEDNVIISRLSLIESLSCTRSLFLREYT